MKNKILALLICLLFSEATCAEKTTLDSLRLRLKEAKDSSDIGLCLMRIGRQYERYNTYSDLKYFELYEAISSARNDSLNIGWSYHLQAGMQFLKGNDSTALSLSQAANIFLTENDSDKYVLAKTYLGTIYFDLGKMYTASKILVEAVEYSSKIKYDNPYGYQVLGEISMKIGNYKEALDYLKKGLESARRAQLPIEEVLILFIWAQTELENRNYLKADSLVKSALQLPISKEEAWCKAQSYTILAQSLLEQRDFKQSIASSDSAIQIAKTIQFKSNFFRNLLIQTSAYLKLNKIDSAGVKLKESEQFIDSKTRLPLKLKHLENQSEFLFAKDSIVAAYEILQDIISITDSLNRAKEARIVSDLQTRYNTELKDQDLHAKSLEIFLKEETIKVERKLRWVLLGVSVMVLIIVYFSFKRYQEKQKMKLEYKILELNQKALQLQMNPHFIFNVMNTLYQWLSEEKLEESKKQLLLLSKLIRNVLNSSRETSISLHEEIESLRAFIELNLILSDIKFDYKIDENLIDTSELAIPPNLIQPIVENAIYHGIRKYKNGTSELIVSFEMKVDYLECKVIDRGEKSLRQENLDRNGLGVSTSIIKERLEYLSKGKYDPFILNSNENSFEVILRMKYEDYWA